MKKEKKVEVCPECERESDKRLDDFKSTLPKMTGGWNQPKAGSDAD